MNPNIEVLRKTRHFALNLIDGLTDEQLNKIPEGFSNNIIWNLGHLVAAQEGVCYKRSGVEANIPDEFFHGYKPGSKPEKDASAEEIAQIKSLLLTSLDDLERDHAAGKLIMNPWTTRYGIDINTIEDGISFLQFHEGLHQGYITAMVKMVK